MEISFWVMSFRSSEYYIQADITQYPIFAIVAWSTLLFCSSRSCLNISSAYGESRICLLVMTSFWVREGGNQIFPYYFDSYTEGNAAFDILLRAICRCAIAPAIYTSPTQLAISVTNKARLQRWTSIAHSNLSLEGIEITYDYPLRFSKRHSMAPWGNGGSLRFEIGDIHLVLTGERYLYSLVSSRMGRWTPIPSWIRLLPEYFHSCKT
jgi:hypothetical protein